MYPECRGFWVHLGLSSLVIWGGVDRQAYLGQRGRGLEPAGGPR